MPAPNRSPTTFMPSISGPSMTSIGRPPRSAICCRSSSVSASTWASMPLTSAWVIRSPTGSARHSSSVASSAPRLAVVLLGDLEQPLGGVGAPVEHDVLDPLPQLGVDLVVDHERAGVDDAHVEAGLDRVEQEDRVDRLAHRVVAAEREATRWRCRRETMAPGRFSLIQRVASMKSSPYVACSSMPVATREDVGVEDDVLGREADLVGEDPVGPLADRLAALEVVGLAVLVEGHDDDGGAVLAAQAGLLDGTSPRPPSARSS